MLRRVGVVGAGVLAAAAAAVAFPLPANAQAAHAPAKPHGYAQTNFVSDQPGRAALTDPNLINPWGVAASPTSPLWVSNAGTSTSTLYAGGVGSTPPSINSLVVNIPGGPPTGQVFNDTKGFDVPGSTTPASFIFAGVGGSITAWASGTTATIAATETGHGYTGLALSHSPFGPLLLAANPVTNSLDVFDSTFTNLSVDGLFRDNDLPKGYAPFNVQEINGDVYVTYAQIDPKTGKNVDKKGDGVVDEFTTYGTLVRRVAAHGQLNSPWGLAIAPSSFGKFGGDLLVGNFGDGRINVFSPSTGRSLGQLTDASGRPITIDGLWSLTPGTTRVGGTDSILFTAGPDGETHGLFGKLTAN
ncbi:TIGR03118 family protein [Rugosimonospora acidiphila]|uniref:TIGR03118 family protein n=1 Tax=Rugosimonospora acidiphila TaxID=556531 RepID=A0ABP9RWA9_9ACTN